MLLQSLSTYILVRNAMAENMFQTFSKYLHPCRQWQGAAMLLRVSNSSVESMTRRAFTLGMHHE